MCYEMHHFDDVSVAFVLFFEFEEAKLQPQVYFNFLKIYFRGVVTCLIVNVIQLIKDCVNNLKWHKGFGFEFEYNGDRLKNASRKYLIACNIYFLLFTEH